MTGRHWLRRDVLMPIIYLLAFGALLFWLFSLLRDLPELAETGLVQLVLTALIIVYVLLALITLRHVLSTYDLERYDPGDPASLKRLMRRRRFRLSGPAIPEAELLPALEKLVFSRHFQLETESLQIGRVYRRLRRRAFSGRGASDRIIILQHEPLNILTVDQILQDTIRYIRGQEQPSARNILLVVTRMAETQDAASAAAGVVNFLGKFRGGSLCPVLLAPRQQRLFHPADRTLHPRAHRLFQDLLYFRLLRTLRQLQKGDSCTPST